MNAFFQVRAHFRCMRGWPGYVRNVWVRGSNPLTSTRFAFGDGPLRFQPFSGWKLIHAPQSSELASSVHGAGSVEEVTSGFAGSFGEHLPHINLGRADS